MCSTEELQTSAADNVDGCENTSTRTQESFAGAQNSIVAIWSSEYCKEVEMTRDILSGVTSVMIKSSRRSVTTMRSDMKKSTNKFKRLHRRIQHGERSDSSVKENIDVVDTKTEVTLECSPFHSKLQVRCCADLYPNN